MTVQDLIDVLEKLDKNKPVEVFDVDNYCWIEIKKSGVREESEVVTIAVD